ncbi:MAG: hypothetical protein KAW41_05415 [Candidatus Diapherotrites archaeon]|nr:hypothetical protein [Candidatus Diapherotrites archaeon]
MLKLFVCQICGEPHLADEVPTDCQFCGAPKKYLKMAEDYSTLWGAELTEQEKTDMEATLVLEVNATAYYTDVAKANTKYEKYERLFKALARVEKEHAEVAAKFLGVDLPEFVGEKSRGDVKADLERTKELETGAMGRYKEFMANATSDKVKNLYDALIHAENGHKELAEAELS